MAHLGPMPVEGLVHVERHAIDQARARFASYEEMTDIEIGTSIAADVRDAMGRGLVYDQRPRGFFVTERRRHGGGGLMHLGQRFVMHPKGDKGWVVSLIAPAGCGVAVVTTLRKLGS